MADAPFVIGSLAVNPNLVNDYARAFFNDRIEEFAAGWDGCIRRFNPSDEVLPGTQVNVPRLVMVPAATRIDPTNTAAVDSAAGPTSKQGRGPVLLWGVPVQECFDHAVRAYKRNNVALEAEMAEMMVRRIINGRKLNMLAALRGALAAMSTSAHIEDETSASTKTAQLTDLMDAKALLGDAQAALRVWVMHSRVWLRLKKDIVTGSNYNIERIGDEVVIGGVPGLEGLKIHLCDDGTVVAGASSGAHTYYTFGLGEDAVWMQDAPRTPLFTATMNVDKRARSYKFAMEDVCALGIFGMDMSANNASPTEAQLYTSGNWSEAFSHDHRDVKAVILKTQGD